MSAAGTVANGLSGVGTGDMVAGMVALSFCDGPNEPVRQPADAVMIQVRNASRIYDLYPGSISYTIAQRI
jgi:hypothetical protein